MITFKAVPTYETAVSTMILAEAAITTMPTMTGGMRRPRASTHGHDDEDQHGIPDQRSRTGEEAVRYFAARLEGLDGIRDQ